MVLKGLRGLTDKQEKLDSIKRNIEWAKEHREEMHANFPNTWVAIDNEYWIRADPSLQSLLQYFRSAGLLSPTVIYIYSGFGIQEPLILLHQDVATYSG